MDASLHEVARAQPRAPSGTISFLFSDIEGSTQRWERFPEAMAGALRSHDAIVGTAMARNGGFVFKTVGDAFCVAFANVRSAVDGALDAQRALAAADFDAVGGIATRMAIHTGTADERNGDYFGPTVNRVARITAAGHGGQILLSAISGELVRADLPTDASLRELGEFQIKDLASTERLFALVVPDLAAEFPPLRTHDIARSNLPAMVTSFVGREDDLAALRALIAEHRLVTLVGPGGVGKTRAAIQLGDSLRNDFSGGVWFVDLATLGSPELVVDEFASVLGVRSSGTDPLVASIVAAIGTKPTLAIFDNCEHVIDAVIACVQRLLEGCPALRIIATSREGLRITGEWQFGLPPLSLPLAHAPVTAASAHEYSAVALLVDRAIAANRAFALTEQNAGDVVALCRELDALPFALELAAPRLMTFTPKELLERIGERFQMLRGSRVVGPDRTRTLLSLIDWSHDLLSVPERALFRRLSVFAGGWTIEGAVAVDADFEPDEYEIVDRLEALVSKSMVVAEHGADRTRFRFLESMHQYARERLTESSERADIERRFAQTVLAFVRRTAGALGDMRERAWLDEIEREIENIRAVLRASLERGGDVALGAEIVVALGFFWHARRPTEGAAWLDAARNVAERCPAVLRARVFLESARVDVASVQTVPFSERAVALYREVDDTAGIVRALEYLGQSLINAGRYAEAETCLTESIARAPSDGDRVATARARALRGYAIVYGREDALDEASRDLESALADLEARLRYRDAGVALRGLAHIAIASGRPAEAAERVARALLLCEDLDDARGTGLLRFELAHALFLDGRIVDARANALESLHLLSNAGIPMALSHATVILAATLERLGDTIGAAELMGYVRSMTEHATSPIPPLVRRLHRGTIAELGKHLGDADLERAMTRGASFDSHAIERIARREISVTHKNGDSS